MEKTLAWVEGKTGLQLAAQQRQAIELAYRSKVLWIFPGEEGVDRDDVLRFECFGKSNHVINIRMATAMNGQPPAFPAGQVLSGSRHAILTPAPLPVTPREGNGQAT